MKYTEFKNGLNNGQEYSIYLFEGEDAFFRESGVSLLKNKFVQEPSLNFVNLQSDTPVNQIITSLEGYPFMSQKRMTLIREFYPKQEVFKAGLKGYLDDPLSTSILVILNEKPCEPLKKFASVCVVDCSKADTSLLIKWIKAECSLSGVSIDGETAKTLSEFCLSDMTRIKTETHKLIAYAQSGGTITIQDVNNLVARDLEYKVYELTDYIGKKNFDKALLLISDMTGKGEPASRILSYIYNYFRRLLHVSISDMSNSEIAEAFAVKEFAVSKMKQQASMFKKKALKNAVDMLCLADFNIKSGLADGECYSYLTIFKIMTEK